MKTQNAAIVKHGKLETAATPTIFPIPATPFAGVATGLLLALAIAACGASPPTSSKPPAAATQAIEGALKAAGLPAAHSLEITSGRLVATFEIDDAALELMAAAEITSPREFASKAVMTIRNAELPFDLVNDYRVTMNGPPPGPGLITRYGSARFSEGSSVSWEPGSPK